MIHYIPRRFTVIRDRERCVDCGVCVHQCSNECHYFDEDGKTVLCNSDECVACHRCVDLCPKGALRIEKYVCDYRDNANWTPQYQQEICRQAETGSVLLSAMGNPKPYPIYWDKILLNASQVTNPSIDPLREPMEIRTILGRKPEKLEVEKKGKSITKMPPQVMIETPILFSAMSFGSISLNAQKSLAMAAKEIGTLFNTGEGGLHPDLQDYCDCAVVQVASGRFGVHKDYLNHSKFVEIKIGQGAKPGIGGHLPGEKVNVEVSNARMIPEGSDAISPAPHHDIYSIEDLRQLIWSLKQATDGKKPVSVKIAAVHNIAAIASGVARAGADIVVIDGFRGGTGAAPTRIRDNVGIPIELALAAADQRLRDEGIRSTVSLIAAGSFRCSSDIVKAIALGADACYIASAPLIAMGCHMCQTCNTGKCNWGIATQRPELTKRLNPEIAHKRVINLINAWNHEIKEIMGGMGINSIDSLRGNRLMLRGIGLSDKELEILGIKHAGE
ncbi:MAG: 4Fe-4S binding protein [Eubacterium sp.]|nr:4Fe-4S binding protein [Eubacterium sp.]MDE6766851.1 4Fe-4S binding protein [Eubacterium sp.]